MTTDSIFNLVLDLNPLSFSEESGATQVIEQVRRFATSQLSGRETFSRGDFDQMASLGLCGVNNSLELGGSELGPEVLSGIIYELARRQLGPAVYLSVHNMVSYLIESWASTDLHRAFARSLATGEKLAAFALTESASGSDAAALKTLAREDGDQFILNGEKIYITSAPVADVFLLFARINGGDIAAFIVERNQPGLEVGPAERKMGCEAAPIASISMDNCQVPKAHLLSPNGYKVALSGLAGGRVNIGAAACGLASRALQGASEHAAQRTQFGKPIGEFQGIQFMIADMASKSAAASLLVYQAAKQLREGSKDNLWPSMAKCFATDAAMEVTTDAVQVLGGAGYLSDYGMEKLMRDAKMLQIVEGTNQIQRMLIGKSLIFPSST